MCANTHTRGRGDISQKERSPIEGAYLQGLADDNLKKKSLNWMERNPQGTWKDVIKLRNN